MNSSVTAEVARARFQTAIPFSHLVLHSFLGPQMTMSAREQWPSAHAKAWRGYQGRKFAISKLDDMPHYLSFTVSELNSSATLNYLESVSGIYGLVPDDTLQGAGLHETREGGKLGMHVDFNVIQHPKHGKLYRRLNLLVYLNEITTYDEGGWLELSEGANHEHIVVRPDYETAVLMNIQHNGWHGHPKPLAKGLVRRSIAMYYYTVEKPDNWVEDLTTTNYRYH